MPRQQAVELVARLRDRLADLLRQRARPARRARPPRRRESAADAALRSASGTRGPGGLRGARGGGLGGDAGGVVGGQFGDQRAGGGVVDLQRGHAVQCCARGARRGEKIVEHRGVVEACRASGVGGTRGATARRRRSPGRARRIASTMPSSGQRASTTKPGARSLMAWWWMLLIRRALTPGYSCARRVPGTTRRRGNGARSSRRRGAPARRALGRDVLVQRAAEATFISCRPRQMPNTGLPASTKASTSSIS